MQPASRPECPDHTTRPPRARSGGNDQHRCRAASRCPDGTTIHDDDGHRVDRVGVALDDGDLCPTCERIAVEALRWLPVDYRDLGELLGPTGEWRPRDPDMPIPRRIKLHAPLPLRTDVIDLQWLIDREVRAWAGSVAGHAGMWASREWSANAAARSRWPVRIEQSCQLLEHRFGQLLGLTDVEHAARSVTAKRGDGHDPDRTRVLNREWLVTRDGWEAAMKFRDLHERAERFCGRHPGHRVMTPCTTCHRRALIRHIPRPGVHHPANQVVCRCCGTRQSDDDYSAVVNAAYQAAGLPRRDDYARNPGDAPDVPVGRGGVPGSYGPLPLPVHGPWPAEQVCDWSTLPTWMCGCPRHTGQDVA